MENANPSSSTPNSEFLDPKKKLEIESWLEDESPINVMSKQHYKWIMSKGLELRQKPSNPSKNSNFVGRVRGLKVFVGNFTYKCNFMILEDTTSIIDHHLGEEVFEKPFVRETSLVYDQEEGTVVLEKDNEKITFKMPNKMETFNHINFKDIDTDSIPSFILKNNDNYGKTYYSDSLILGPEYREDEMLSLDLTNKIACTKFLIKNEEEIFTDIGDSVRIYPDGCTAVVKDPNLPIDDFEVRPLKEYIIKFTVMSGKMPLDLDYKTFCASTGLDYNNDNYVAHPSPEVVKDELEKITINEELVDKTQSTRFEVSDLDHNKGNTSSKVNLNTNPLILTTVVDIQALLGYYNDELREDSDEDLLEAGEEIDEELLQKNYDISIHGVMECVDGMNEVRVDGCITLRKTLNRVFKTLKADSAVKETMQKTAYTNNTTSGKITGLTELLRNANFQEIITQMNAFYTSLNTLSTQCAIICESLKEEPKFNHRLLKAAEVYIQNFTRLTEITKSLKVINLSLLARIIVVKNTHVTMKADISSIKGMVIETFHAFKEFSSTTASSSATIITITQTKVHATVEGENSEKQVVV
uniref:Protein kinase-like domain, concanavalin A-like lectin/glucanase domain protein n=1 Tax=Tanacetum cinerariifolium TaxID=118510 RepID=A0A6L2JYE3_TANCI|nr:protein kinase-like domain, concanavalin A-like lectin/glucanase domain protein [Tanacetum cinerariifolium]